jgi:hypothetical protein
MYAAKQMLKPILLLLTVIAAGCSLLWYSLLHAAPAGAQTAGGIIGTYELMYMLRDEESYVIMSTAHASRHTVISPEPDDMRDFKTSDITLIWHFNKQDKKWEEVPVKKKGEK